MGLDASLPLLLVTGGSQGARHLNQMVCQALPGLLTHCQVFQISGKELYNETRAQADSLLADQDEALRQRYRLVAYLNEEMPLALQAADLVLCRSGASTLTELAILGKASILVPLSPAVGGPAQQDQGRGHAPAGALHEDGGAWLKAGSGEQHAVRGQVGRRQAGRLLEGQRRGLGQQVPPGHGQSLGERPVITLRQ